MKQPSDPQSAIRSPQSSARIYARPPNFVVHYRSGRRLRWTTEAAADYAVLLLLAGRLRWRGADAEAGELGAGGALLAAPGDRLSAVAEGPAELLTLTLSPVYVLDGAVRARLMRDGAAVRFSAPAAAGDARLGRLARDLAEELRGAEAGQELVVSALIEQALVHLLRRYANVRRAESLELSRAGLVDRRIRRAVELMHAHLGRDLPLGELARAAHLSPFHFARLFKKLTGATPHAYLASLRAARAQTLLAETDLSVTEIGARVGYASSSHFSKAFRQATGLTPRAYRKAVVSRQ
jgi:AraC family transcriptional regulator